jgi:large subunit ribosomal protein L10
MKEATLQKKVEQVNEVVEKFQQSSSAVFVDYLGLTVEQITTLRTQLYAQGCDLKVIKNNVLRRATQTVGYDGLEDIFSGPSAVAFSTGTANVSKIIYEFAKKNDKMEVKAGVVDGKVMNVNELKVYATLPNKEGMLSMLLSVLQAPIRNLALAVKAVAEKEVQ